MEKDRRASIKERLGRAAIATALFIACPGDDIFALLPQVTDSNIPAQITPARTLELFHIHKRQEDEHEFFPPTESID